MWKYQNIPHDPSNYTKYLVKVQKYLQIQSLFLILFKVKTVFSLYMDNWKPQKPFTQQPNNFLTLEANKYFYY
jgi:hypothetical protein